MKIKEIVNTLKAMREYLFPVEKLTSYFKSINSKNALSLLDNFQEALAKKEIQMYFTDEIPKSTVDKYSWNGKITKTKIYWISR